MITNMIETLILTGELPSNSIISETQLAQRFNTSRVPVREALIALRDIGLVEPIHRKGYKIIEVTAQQQFDLLEIRQLLETLCLTKCCENMNNEYIQHGQKIIQILDDENHAFLECLQQTHNFLSTTAEQDVLSNMMKRVQTPSRCFWFRRADKNDFKIARKLHRNIIQACINKNKTEALNASENLINYLYQFTERFQHDT